MFLYVIIKPFRHGQDVIQDQFLRVGKLVWFKSFLSSKLVAFPEEREMQTGAPSIWTRDTDSISYDDNRYAEIEKLKLKTVKNWKRKQLKQKRALKSKELKQKRAKTK